MQHFGEYLDDINISEAHGILKLANLSNIELILPDLSIDHPERIAAIVDMGLLDDSE